MTREQLAATVLPDAELRLIRAAALDMAIAILHDIGRINELMKFDHAAAFVARQGLPPSAQANQVCTTLAAFMLAEKTEPLRKLYALAALAAIPVPEGEALQ